MKTKETIYSIKCDRCNHDLDIPGAIYYDVEDAREDASIVDWKYIKGKDLCPDCWQWSEDETEVIMRPKS